MAGPGVASHLDGVALPGAGVASIPMPAGPGVASQRPGVMLPIGAGVSSQFFRPGVADGERRRPHISGLLGDPSRDRRRLR